MVTAVAERFSVKRDGFDLVSGGDLHDPAVLADPAALGQAFDHGLGGAGTEFAVTRLEGELEMGRRRQLAFQHGRETIGRHHVEADAGNGDDAGVLISWLREWMSSNTAISPVMSR